MALRRKMASTDNREAYDRWENYPFDRGHLTLVNGNIGRRRRLLEEESPRLFMDRTNQFKILRVLAESKGNESSSFSHEIEKGH